jgi:hypothetical protein
MERDARQKESAKMELERRLEAMQKRKSKVRFSSLSLLS